MIWLFVGLGVYILLAGGLLFWFRARTQKMIAQNPTTVEQRIQHAKTAQQFIGFEAIEDDMVRVDQYRYRAYIEVEPVNFYYMTAAEQQVVEDAFRSFLDGLRWPVQICVNSVPLDLSDHLNHLETKQGHLPPNLQAYAQELAINTREWIAQYAPLSKRYIIVVCFDHKPNTKVPLSPEIIRQQAKTELDTRVHTIIEVLSRAKLPGRRLSTDEIIALFYQVYNRHAGSAASARGLMEENLESIYVTSTLKEEELAVQEG